MLSARLSPNPFTLAFYWPVPPSDHCMIVTLIHWKNCKTCATFFGCGAILPTSNAFDLDGQVCSFGWLVGEGERQRTGRKRAADVRVRLLKPSEDLLRTITDEDFAKEFSQPWGGLTESDHGKLEDTLRATINAANHHISILEQHISRGKTWAHDLTRIHVHLTACFCEYFDNEFEPSRTNNGVQERGAFQETVELLAKPIFS